MSPGKWALYALAVIAAVTAGLSTMPYGWAHIAATALSAGITVYGGITGTVIARTAGKAAG